MGYGSTTKGPIPIRVGYNADNKGYTKDDIAALMGFAGVYNGHNLRNIWELFNATKGKNIDAHCRHLFARMKQWACDCCIQINTSVYLEQETIKAIVELQFNPGEGVAHLALASKGLSILACRTCTTQETERIRKQEQALSATKKTRQLEDLLHLSKGTMRAPADDFWELKMNVGTFMSLVWVLLGSNCDYYKSLRQIHKTLKLKEVYALKLKFSPENCRRITWAILDDGRAFFNEVKTTMDFTGPEMSFPQSYLIDILNNVRYAFPIERASFPNKWQHRERVRDDQGAKSPGGQGRRQRTGDTPPRKRRLQRRWGWRKPAKPLWTGRLGRRPRLQSMQGTQHQSLW